MQRRPLAVAAIALAVLAPALPAAAQDRPALKTVVGFPPGGSAYTLARWAAPIKATGVQLD